MRRWIRILPAILVVVIVVGVFTFRFIEIKRTPQPVLLHLARAPNQAYKFNLCLEAYAVGYADPSETQKTDYTFHDPFRSAYDTITPSLVSWNQSEKTASFQVIIVIGQVQTFRETIAHVAALDGISIILPDKQNNLQRSNEPQFIVSAISASGSVAVLDYTCSQEWKWSSVT
jgi:hypothetical protein